MLQKVFISHSHDDKEFCERLAAQLRLKLPQTNVFFSSRDIRINNFVMEIGRQIEDREIFIVVISPKSVVSPWVNLECSTAIHCWIQDQQRRAIIPVLHKDAAVGSITVLLNPFPRIDCIGLNEPAGFDQLVEALKSAALNQVAPSNPEVQRAFNEIPQVVRELLSKGRSTQFSPVNNRLKDKGINVDALPYKSFTEFIEAAELQGLVRIVRTGKHPIVMLPEEDLSVTLASNVGEAGPDVSAVHAIGDEPISREQLLIYMNFLELSLPFINTKGVHTYCRMRQPNVSAQSIKSQLDALKAQNQISSYKTDPMSTNETGVKQQVDALRLVRDDAMKEELAKLHSEQPDNWAKLSPIKRIVFLTTIVVLSDEQPDGFHWHALRSRLIGGGDETDWDVVFATALETGVIGVDFKSVRHQKSGNEFMIKAIELNKAHPDVKALL